MSKKLKYAVVAVVVVSFMFFGIYSTIASRKAFVAKVDGIKITTQEFNKYLSNRKQQIFQNVHGDTARYNQALAFVENPQFHQFALNEMVNTLVISKFLKENDLNVSVETIAQHIKTLATFQKDGKFDTEYFKQYLKYMGVSEYDFLKNLMPELEQNIFGSLLAPLQIQSDVLVEEYAKSLKRARDIDILTIAKPTNITFTEDELQTFYEKHKTAFVQKPQHFVTISYVDDYINRNFNIFTSTPEMIAKYYNEEYVGRVMKFYYVKFNNEAEASKVYEIVKKQGISLQSIAETMLKQPLHYISHSEIASSNTIDDPVILNEIKDLKIGNITSVIKNNDTFLLAQVLDIQENEFLDSKSSQSINQEIITKRKCHNVNVYVEKIKQELQAGASFESVALKYGFPISKQVVIDETNGDVRDAYTNLETRISPVLLEHVIKTNDTSYGYVVNIDNKNCSYVIYKQNRIEPERIKTLPEVRGTVISLFKKEKEKEMMITSAKSIIGQIQSLNTNPRDYSSQRSFTSKLFYVSQNPHSEIFKHNVGSVFLMHEGDFVQVIKINKEIPYTGVISKEEVSVQEKYVQDTYYNAFLRSFIGSLYKRYRVETKEM
jgi:hypothetical protein